MLDAITGLTRIVMRDVYHVRQSTERRFEVRIPELLLHAGDVALLTGENGSGKSSILEMLGLVSRPTDAAQFQMPGVGGDASGMVDVMSFYRADARKELAAIRAGRIGFIVQTGALIPFLNVWMNVALPKSYAPNAPGEDVDALLASLELSDLTASMPHQLSIGQRQRTAIARAMVNRPAVILADEPTAALDPAYKSKVMDLLISMAQRIDAVVLIATHEAPRIGNTRVRRLHLNVTSELIGDVEHVTSTLSEVQS